MSSIEPDSCSCEVNGGAEVSGGFVISGSDGSELLELFEEVLDEVACLVEVTVEGTIDLAMGSAGNDDRLSGGEEGIDDPLIGIEPLVGDQRIGLHVGQQMVGADQVVDLTASQEEADGVAEGIHQGMDLGAQSTARAADRLVLPGFFWAPALC